MFFSITSFVISTDFLSTSSRFCKDISFSNQEEYRFIGLDELIMEPVFYSFSFNSQYLMVPIERLKQPLTIKM